MSRKLILVVGSTKKVLKLLPQMIYRINSIGKSQDYTHYQQHNRNSFRRKFDVKNAKVRVILLIIEHLSMVRTQKNI